MKENISDWDKIVLKELLSIKARHKKLKPSIVVDEARSRDNPLHNYFDWNDSSAGQKYRIWQARYLISQTVQLVTIDKKPKVMKSFFNVRDEKDEPCYVTVKEVTESSNKRTQVLNKLINEMEYVTDLMRLLKQL